EWNDLRVALTERRGLLASLRESLLMLASAETAPGILAQPDGGGDEAFGLTGTLDREGKLVIRHSSTLGRLAPAAFSRDEPSEYAVVCLDKRGRPLARRGFLPVFEGTHGTTHVTSLSLIHAFPRGTARIQVERKGRPLYRALCDGASPAIEKFNATGHEN